MFVVESEKVHLRWKGNKEGNDILTPPHHGHLKTGVGSSSIASNSITSKQSNDKVSTSKDGEDERVEDSYKE